MKNINILEMKSMTKKAYKEMLKSRRSTVALGMNTGTRSMRSNKDYDRRAAKAQLRKEVAALC